LQQILDYSDESDRSNFGLYGIKETMKGDFGKSDYILNTTGVIMNKNFIDTRTTNFNS